MTGSILNAAGIVIGGLLGLLLARQFSAGTQAALRSLTGLIVIIVGLQLTWSGLNQNSTSDPLFSFSIFNGSYGHSHLRLIGHAMLAFSKNLAALLMALILGRFAGRLLHIQSSFNRFGRIASERFAAARPDDPNRFNEGFAICTLLFCAGPLGPIGAVQDGLNGYWVPLAIKMVMDGLAAMGFVTIYGWGVMLAAVPVLAYQGAITLAAHRLEPILNAYHLVDSVNAVSGMLIFCVAMIIMDLKKVELADYLPSLIMAPLVTWLLR
jgi:uncharacterized membrane protein YqgA involved in biofilm formation